MHRVFCATRATLIASALALVACLSWASAGIAQTRDEASAPALDADELREGSRDSRKSDAPTDADEEGEATEGEEADVEGDEDADEDDADAEGEDEADADAEGEDEDDADAEGEDADEDDSDEDPDEDSEESDDDAEEAEDDAVEEPVPAAPAAPLFQAVVAGVPIRITGIVHARIELTQGVQSFDNATPVAPTSAVNPAVMAAPDDLLLSFQVQQTRLGMTIGDPNNFRGIVEIDFTHFDQSSPTVQAFPRIRIGLLEWTFAPNQKLFLGQTWDIFGNATGPQLLSHSFNLVGSLFRAGNIGFMRQQLGWSGRFDSVELAVAVGLQGANTGPTFNNIEGSLTPTGAARLMLHLGDRQVIGVSGIVTALRYASGMETEHRPAMGVVAFTDAQLGTFNLHAELYVAQNLAGTGALSIGAGRFGTNVVEMGGYLSGRVQIEQHAVTAGFGVAGVLNDTAVAPGYTPANPTGTPPTTLGVLTPATGPGIIANLSGFLGYWYSPLPGLSIVLEPYFHLTHFALDAGDVARGVVEARGAVGARAGAMFQF